MPDSLMHTLSGVAALQHLGVIRVIGEDSVNFLQGQLTQDVAQMDMTHARLAAFCNAKGRMQASFIVLKRSSDEVLLICSRDILAQTLKRLSMFVLRAKAKLTDATDEYLLFGLAGSMVEAFTAPAQPAWSKEDRGEASVVFLHPGAGQRRALWCAPAGTPEPVGGRLDSGRWDWLEVQSGIAMVSQPIFEAFVPQMLNYESVGGVSFKKGCYPGQEVVARSQFRGTLKRRAYLVVTNGDRLPGVGEDVFHIKDSGQPCGTVAMSAESPDGVFCAIVSMQTSAAADASAGQLTLGSPTGSPLIIQPLPYPLLEDI
ncbi:MAG: folate-binding protein [Pseudomonadota bacterium]